MKKNNTIIILFVTFFVLYAQTKASAQDLFTKESHVLHGGVGFGGFGVGNCYAPLPVVSFSYDQGILHDLFFGNLGVGGAVALKHYNWNCNYGNTHWRWNRIYIGARATYHFHFLNEEHLDLYAGASAGAFIWTGDTDSPYGSYGPALAPGLFGGGNYWLKPNIGVYAEVGYGLGIVNTGIAINF